MPFVKGDPRINRKGRPKKGRTLTDILAAHGSKSVEMGDGQRMTQKQLLAEKLWELARTGDVAAIKYIYDRIDGRPIESVRHSGGVDIGIERRIYDAIHSETDTPDGDGLDTDAEADPSD